MTVSLPPIQWPSGLLEVGPDQDRTILLRSEAEIAGARYAVMALRIDPTRMAPDLRSDVPAHTYDQAEIGDIIEVFSMVTELGDEALVQLATGTYAILMIPSVEA